MSTIDLKRKPAWPKVAGALWLALWPLLAALHLYPIRFTSLRLTILVGVILLWGGALLLFWNRKPVRLLCFAIAFMLAALCFLPGQSDNPTMLRYEYVRALSLYTGTTYV